MNTMTEAQAPRPTITLTDDERQRCEVWTRVMGYHRPVASFNIGKKGEHCERRFFARSARGRTVGAARGDGRDAGRRRRSRAAPARDALRVGGFVPFTSTDYPDALAAVVFCQGCPWRCGYCHNPHLIAGARRRRARLRAHPRLARRRAAACSTRSCSPAASRTAQAGARRRDRARCARWDSRSGCTPAARIRGASPQVLPLRRLGRPRRQGAARRLRGGHRRAAAAALAAFASLDLVRDAGVRYEVRTTVHPTLTPPDALERLARELAERAASTRWMLQPFRPTGCADEALVAAAPHGTTLDQALLARLSAHVPVIEVRA